MKIRMGRNNLILGLLILVLVFVIWRWIIVPGRLSLATEGFSQSVQDKVVDRMNPLAGQTNPIANPAAPIGISESAGTALQSMMQTALNVGSLQADGAGSFNLAAPLNPTSIRVDNENSMLGLVQMCKTKGVGDSPFGDPAFAENCGMCLSNGTLITGETFTAPTGVLVYKEDKDAAVAEAKENGYKFPQAIPSVGSATCAGASKSGKGLPVLALNQKDFDAFKKRKACRDNHTIGNECGICVSNKESSWIPADGGIQATTLWLWGAGAATVTVGGVPVSGTAVLSETKPLMFELGRVVEGTVLRISVVKADTTAGPFLYSAITSNGGKYRLPVEKFLNSQRRSTPKYFSEIKTFCARNMPQPNHDTLILQGNMPLTFVESDQLASYDCPVSAFVTTQENADFFVTDPCLINPKGQGPGNYSDACKRKIILESGCSTDGDWYKNLSINFPEAWTADAMKKWITDKVNDIGQTNTRISMGCSGIDITTPCDGFLSDHTPTTDCLVYLYTNESEKNVRVGRAYKNATMPFTSMSHRTGKATFCRDEGSLNPLRSSGEASMRQAAMGYKGQKGIEAVKMFLSDVFTKATGNLDVNIADDQGGKKDSWAQCFGVRIADPTLTQVAKNSINDVIDMRQNCYNFPKTIDIANKRGNKIGVVQNSSGDYVLSFNIKPRSFRSDWASIIHFYGNDVADGTTGSRTPGIWFWPGNTRLHVRIGDYNSPSGDNWNWGIDTDPIPLGQISSFRLECNGKNITLTVNSNVYNVIQPGKRWTGQSHVYAGDRGYQPADAIIDNLCYTIL